MTQRCPPWPVAEWATQLRANSLRQGHPCRLDLWRLQGSGWGAKSCLSSLSLSLGRQWIQHWHWYGRARGQSDHVLQLLFRRWFTITEGGASSWTCDTHRWVDSSFVPLSVSYSIRGRGVLGAAKGSKTRNHKQQPKPPFPSLPSPFLEPYSERGPW